MNSNEFSDLIKSIKSNAKKYYELTGKPLGITGEIGELVISDKLGLTLLEARETGCDAKKGEIFYEIKTRVKRGNSKNFSSQRTSKINENGNWQKLMGVSQIVVF